MKCEFFSRDKLTPVKSGVGRGFEVTSSSSDSEVQ
jgi:hypothetical protein